MVECVRKSSRYLLTVFALRHFCAVSSRSCDGVPNCYARNRKPCTKPNFTCGPCLDGYESDKSIGFTACESKSRPTRKERDASSIPYISLETFLSGGKTERKTEIAKMKNAITGPGFFFIVNHSVPSRLVRETFAASEAYFAWPREEKLKSGVVKDSPYGDSGYSELGVEGLNEDRDANELDPKETYDMNREFMHESSTWNATIIPSYWEAMDELKNDLLQLYAAALELPLDFFDASHNQQGNMLRLSHYFPIRECDAAQKFRVGPHSDYGSFTILVQDDVGGLQMFDRVLGMWKDVNTDPGVFIVSTGDLLTRWTNDHLLSPLHRVVGPGVSTDHGAIAMEDRYSIAYFVNPNEDYVITNIMNTEPPRYKPIKAINFISRRLTATSAINSDTWTASDKGTTIDSSHR